MYTVGRSGYFIFMVGLTVYSLHLVLHQLYLFDILYWMSQKVNPIFYSLIVLCKKNSSFTGILKYS